MDKNLKKVIDEQIKTIQILIGNDHKIKIKEDGFISRGFVIDDGKLIFKFPRKKDVNFKTEIENLKNINELKLGVNLQRVAYVSCDNEYLGLYGVEGYSLEEIKLKEKQEKSVGEQLGFFLKKLHKAKFENLKVCSLKSEILAWQNRFKYVENFIVTTFSIQEQEIINKLMFEYMPKILIELGENLVYSHGDLGDGNIFVNTDGCVGVIDFNESCLLDEAGDFMDVSSDLIKEEMLKVYGANTNLIKKVEIRRDIRPLIVLKAYLERNDENIIKKLVENIRKIAKKYAWLID